MKPNHPHTHRCLICDSVRTCRNRCKESHDEICWKCTKLAMEKFDEQRASPSSRRVVQ